LNRVSILSAWAEDSGVGALVEWVKTPQGKWEAQKVIGEDGKPRKPTAEMIASFFLEMAKGDASVQKGGSRAHRQHERNLPSCGRIPPGQWMTEEKKKAFGWGAYADEPFAYVTIEQYCSAFAWFYDEILLEGTDAEEEVNPALSRRVRALKVTLAKLMGRGRKHETPALLREHVATTLAVLDWRDADEVGSRIRIRIVLRRPAPAPAPVSTGGSTGPSPIPQKPLFFSVPIAAVPLRLCGWHQHRRTHKVLPRALIQARTRGCKPVERNRYRG
jgi:hypothetical protein